MYPGLGPQDLLAAGLTAVVLGGWILFLMRQVSPRPDLRPFSEGPRGNPAAPPRGLSNSLLSPAPMLSPTSQQLPDPLLPCSVPGPRGHSGSAHHGAGPGQGRAPLDPRVSAAADGGGEAAVGSRGTCGSSSHLTGHSVPALGGQSTGPEEAAKPLGASPAP